MDRYFKRTKVKNDQPERILQRKICDHLRTFYPKAYFMSDPSGLKLSPNILKLLKATRSSHSQLDIAIMEPSHEYKGLFLEVKAKSPYKQSGEIYKDEHLLDQLLVMEYLKKKGYNCKFTWSLDHAVEILTGYLGQPITTNEPLFP